MKPIERAELMDLGAYEQVREHFRARVLAVKQPRYVALGRNMTMLFENRDTVMFQIQEMLRTERITNEKAIAHELETYNELVPGRSELSATLFIEYPERDERERMLVALAGVERAFYLELGGERLPVLPDLRGTDGSRTMAVQYVKFPLTDFACTLLRSRRGPLVLGVDHPAYRVEVTISGATLASLSSDLD